MSLQSQWLGPSWHPAFYTFAVAKQACTRKLTCEKSAKPAGWSELDQEFGKEFLDDLQTAVVHPCEKGVSFACEKGSKKARKTKNPVRIACEKGGSIACEKAVMCPARTLRRKHRCPRAQDFTATDAMLAWQVRVQESKEFVQSLDPFFPTRAKKRALSSLWVRCWWPKLLWVAQTRTFAEGTLPVATALPPPVLGDVSLARRLAF